MEDNAKNNIPYKNVCSDCADVMKVIKLLVVIKEDYYRCCYVYLFKDTKETNQALGSKSRLSGIWETATEG